MQKKKLNIRFESYLMINIQTQKRVAGEQKEIKFCGDIGSGGPDQVCLFVCMFFFLDF